MLNYSYFNSSNSSYFKAVESNTNFVSYVITSSASIVVAILSPVAIVGNGIILVAIWRNPSLRTPSYILLAGLAFTDFSTGFITQPIYVANKFMELHMNISDNSQTYIITLALANGCATFFSNMTVLNMTVLAIERWLHMAQRSVLSVRRSCFMILFILFLLVPVVVFRALHSIKNTYGLEADVSSISVLLLCLTITSVAYCKVFRMIRRHQHQIQANSLPENVAQPRINFEKYKKSVFSILYILAIFYLGSLPVAVTLWIRVVSNYRKLKDLFLNVSMVFVFLSPSLNPLLYLWRMKDIRSEFKHLVKRILCIN